MPAATVILLSLSDATTLPALVKYVSTVRPLVISKPVRWIIRPEQINTRLLQTDWHLLLIIEATPKSQDFLLSLTSTQSPALTSGPRSLTIAEHWSTKVGIPSRLTKNFQQHNQTLLHPRSVPSLALTDSTSTTKSSQDLTLSTDLQQWIKTSRVSGAVSMLNLLAFKPGQKDSYLKYGKVFAETIGAKRGGNAKLVGNVLHDGTRAEGDGKWDEFALAQYPSLDHFAEMLASQDYQEANQKYRVPSLFDTFILCTSELEIEDIVKAKL